MMTIMLYGFLGQRFGRVHRYAVRSPAEAVRAMSVTLPGFKQAVIDGGGYKVLVGGAQPVNEDSLHNPQSNKETLRIIPVISGAGGGGFGGFVFGAVLIGASFFLPVAPLFAGFSVSLSSIAFNVGLSMALGGVSQMLSPTQDQQAPTSAGGVERPENKPSYSFDGAVNTAAQGNPVPVCYGRLMVGSQVISAGLDTVQI